MTAVCDSEALEALVADALAPDRALMVQAHVRDCPGCARELTWLRAERRLTAARRNAEPALPPDLWQAVESRIRQAEAPVALRPRRPTRFLARLAFPALTGAAALAAAVLLFVRAPAGPGLRPIPGRGEVPVARSLPGPAVQAAGGVMAVLDAALAEYDQAASELEADLQRSRQRLPEATAQELDRRFGATRQELTRVRAGGGPPGADPETRMRALEDYADYVRSLQAAVLALDGTRK
jgi:hypothetical protein